MDLFVMNKEFSTISVIDTYNSLIWTDRYYKHGDFELILPYDSKYISICKIGNYIECLKSDRTMIIENLKTKTDSEDGNFLIITGRSLESILDRRIVWKMTTVNGNLQNGIMKLLNENVIDPANANRKIPNVKFKDSTNPIITSLKVDTQYTGDNMLTVVEELCEANSIGFKIIRHDSQFIFSLYAGEDRSYDQTTNPYVVFSPNFDNLSNSNYLESDSSYKNIALVGGEGEGAERRYDSTGMIDATGLGRRELFVDARDISSRGENDTTISDSDYSLLLKQRGDKKLAENLSIMSFEGEVDAYSMFKYGEHFFIGDVVQVSNEYGHEAKARILELIISDNTGNGETIYPTFSIVP